MKRCPMCDRTYDDSQTFCVNDGATLVSDASASSYDPMKTIVATPPPPTQSAPLPPPPVYGSGDLPGGQSPSAWQSAPPPQTGSAWGTNLPPAPSAPFGAAQGQQNGLAIASLVCGVLSFLCFGPLSGIPAIILGFMAVSKNKADPARYGGRGLAIGGIVTGAINLVLVVLYIIFVIILAASSR
jgi:hypothetical protein